MKFFVKISVLMCSFNSSLSIPAKSQIKIEAQAYINLFLTTYNLYLCFIMYYARSDNKYLGNKI